MSSAQGHQGAADGGQPWSPFPVQDWSALPFDPLVDAGRVAPLAGDVDPSWGPPGRARRWWTPLVVLLVLGGLLGTAAYVGVATGDAAPRTSATAFLPTDGSVAYERTDTTRESTTTSTTALTESALLYGANAQLGGDFSFFTLALADVTDDQGLRVWRTTSTPVNAGRPTAQTTRVYRTEGDVELLGEAGPSEGYVYRPGLVELPATVRAGQTWTGSGTAGGTRRYVSSFRADAAGDGCLVVSGTLELSSGASTARSVVNRTRTWCRGQGIVAATSSVADVRTTTSRLDRGALPSPATAAPVYRWPDPVRWRPREGTIRSTNPQTGDGPMTGAASAGVTPVRTTSGLVVHPLNSPDDLVATESTDGTTWTTRWRAHPGGKIASLAGFGNVLVVTTSQRRLVAYSDEGLRLWSRALDEIGNTEAVRLDDTSAVVVDLSGHVEAFDLRTGEVRWSQSVGSDVRLAPVVGSGLVVVMDRGGTVTALDASDGTARWTASLLGDGGVVTPDAVVVLQDQTVHALRLTDGRTRWLRPVVGTLSGFRLVGDRVAVATNTSTVLLDGDGQVTARFAPCFQLTVNGDQLVLWGADEAQLVDATGRLVTRWAVPAATVASENRLVMAEPGGVVLFASVGWTLQEWSA